MLHTAEDDVAEVLAYLATVPTLGAPRRHRSSREHDSLHEPQLRLVPVLAGLARLLQQMDRQVPWLLLFAAPVTTIRL